MHRSLYEEVKHYFEEQKLADTSNERKANNDRIQNLILKFVIKERLPLQKVESVHLNRLIECKN